MPEVTTTLDKIIVLKLWGTGLKDQRVAFMLSSIDIVKESECERFRMITTKSGNQACVRTDFDSIVKFMTGNFEDAEEKKKD